MGGATNSTCTNVATNSTRVPHKVLAGTVSKVVYTNKNSTKVVHTNSTKVVHMSSTKVVHMNSTKIVHMNSVHCKVVTHSGVATNSTCVYSAPCSCLNSRSCRDSWRCKQKLELILLLYIVGSISDSRKGRTATPTIL